MKVFKFKNTMLVIFFITALFFGLLSKKSCLEYEYFKAFMYLVCFCGLIYSFIGNYLSYTAITNDSLILKGPHKKTVIEFRKMRYIYRSSNTKSIIIPVSLQFSDGHNKIALTSLSQDYKELIVSAVLSLEN